MKTREGKNFTLIELLVVIFIIGLLAALLFPAIGTVRAHARKITTLSTIKSLEAAILQYESQYGLLPFAYGPNTKTLLPGTDDNEYDALIERLSCVDIVGGSNYNVRRTRFLAGLPITGANSNEKTLTDPYKVSGQSYGRRLAIAVNLDGTNQVTFGGKTYNGKLFIWSYGPNGTNQSGVSSGSGNDDIPSWE